MEPEAAKKLWSNESSIVVDLLHPRGVHDGELAGAADRDQFFGVDLTLDPGLARIGGAAAAAALLVNVHIDAPGDLLDRRGTEGVAQYGLVLGGLADAEQPGLEVILVVHIVELIGVAVVGEGDLVVELIGLIRGEVGRARSAGGDRDAGGRVDDLDRHAGLLAAAVVGAGGDGRRAGGHRRDLAGLIDRGDAGLAAGPDEAGRAVGGGVELDLGVLPGLADGAGAVVLAAPESGLRGVERRLLQIAGGVFRAAAVKAAGIADRVDVVGGGGIDDPDSHGGIGVAVGGMARKRKASARRTGSHGELAALGIDRDAGDVLRAGLPDDALIVCVGRDNRALVGRAGARAHIADAVDIHARGELLDRDGALGRDAGAVRRLDRDRGLAGGDAAHVSVVGDSRHLGVAAGALELGIV